MFSGLFQFNCVTNGYESAIRMPKKISKTSFSNLRKLGHVAVVYVDDSYLQGNKYLEYIKNVMDTIRILKELVFVMHLEKSMIIPTQAVKFWGFVI